MQANVRRKAHPAAVMTQPSWESVRLFSVSVNANLSLDAHRSCLFTANVGGVFLVLGFGCLFALIVALIEFLWNVKKVAVEEKVSGNLFDPSGSAPALSFGLCLKKALRIYERPFHFPLIPVVTLGGIKGGIAIRHKHFDCDEASAQSAVGV